MRIPACLRAAIAGALLFTALPAGAQEGRSIALVRDAETETVLTGFLKPIYDAAGIDSAAAKLYLVKEDSINAFVANGQNIFVHTGLLSRSDNPDQLLGVLAHETGHIAGGHLTRGQSAMAGSTTTAIVTSILGAAALIMGAGDAGMAIISGGQNIAMRDMLQYSRTQESSADQAGMTYLDAIGRSGRGMLEFFRKLEYQEMLLAGRQDPYFRTHPMNRDRINALSDRVERSPYRDLPPDPVQTRQLNLIKAKIYGFFTPPAQVLNNYAPTDTTEQARYARAIALYRLPDLDKAVPAIDALIAEFPDNPWYLELKGQMLVENGRFAEAVAPYRAAVSLSGGHPLLRVGLGQSLLGLPKGEGRAEATRELEIATQADDSHGMGWYLLAQAYGQEGRIGEAALATAERYLRMGKLRDAQGQAHNAIDKLPAGSPGALRANDIISAAARLRRENE